MAVISGGVNLIGEKRSGQKGTNLVRTYAKVWRVETDSALDGPAVAMAASGIATQFVTTYASGNDSDSYALCVSVQAEEEGDSRKSWIVTEQYSTAPPGNPTSFANPLLDPIAYSLGFDSFRKSITQDINGDEIATTADEPIDPPVETDDSRPVYVVRRNESSVSLPFLLSIKDTVNANPWKGCAARTVKLRNVSTGEIQQRNNINYYTVTYEFHLNRDTWDAKILNFGRRCYVPLLDKYIYTKEPHFLNASGVAVDYADAVAAGTVTRSFRVYTEFDFNLLGL